MKWNLTPRSGFCFSSKLGNSHTSTLTMSATNVWRNMQYFTLTPRFIISEISVFLNFILFFNVPIHMQSREENELSIKPPTLLKVWKDHLRYLEKSLKKSTNAYKFFFITLYLRKWYQRFLYFYNVVCQRKWKVSYTTATWAVKGVRF